MAKQASNQTRFYPDYNREEIKNRRAAATNAKVLAQEEIERMNDAAASGRLSLAGYDPVSMQMRLAHLVIAHHVFTDIAHRMDREFQLLEKLEKGTVRRSTLVDMNGDPIVTE